MSCCGGGNMVSVQVTVGGAAIASGIVVRGDDVHMQRARQTAQAMCMVCENRVVGEVRRKIGEVWRVKRGVVGCRRRPGEGVPAAMFAACPLGVWVMGVWRRVWWRGATWKGVPAAVRARLWMRGVRPRGEWSGCGCVAAWLLAWRRVQRRFPALLT